MIERLCRRRGRHRASAGSRLSRPLLGALRLAALLSILAGAGLLGAVAWDLWGTSVATARIQSGLRADLVEHGFPVRPLSSRAVGLILIPRLRLEAAFVQGVTTRALARGPGHYPDTPLPGQGGNVVIAGHRTTYGAPFWGLGTLRAGDEIVLLTRTGRFLYRVRWLRIVAPDDWSVIQRTSRPSLTLTTCSPWFSARERLVVRAVQVYGRTPGGFLGVTDIAVSQLM